MKNHSTAKSSFDTDDLVQVALTVLVPQSVLSELSEAQPLDEVQEGASLQSFTGWKRTIPVHSPSVSTTRTLRFTPPRSGAVVQVRVLGTEVAGSPST